MRFIESILFSDGQYHHLDLHQHRVDRTLATFAAHSGGLSLVGLLPDLNMDGRYKVRVVYETDAQDSGVDLEFIQYYPRPIDCLEVVETAVFDYAFKYEDRSRIHQLFQASEADDIIMCIDGLVTDSSYANLAFWNGSEWLTPEIPLLEGVRRAKLLDQQRIKTASIYAKDIKQFEKVSLINAMLDLGELCVPTDQIRL